MARHGASTTAFPTSPEPLALGLHQLHNNTKKTGSPRGAAACGSTPQDPCIPDHARLLRRCAHRDRRHPRPILKCAGGHLTPSGNPVIRLDRLRRARVSCSYQIFSPPCSALWCSLLRVVRQRVTRVSLSRAQIIARSRRCGRVVRKESKRVAHLLKVSVCLGVRTNNKQNYSFEFLACMEGEGR